MSLTVPCAARVTVTTTAPLTHRCPFVDEIDHGTAALTWRTVDATLELHALTAWLGGFAEEKVSHEDLTDTIATRLAALSGIEAVSVETRWVTAGAEVVVRAVPGQPLHPGGA